MHKFIPALNRKENFWLLVALLIFISILSLPILMAGYYSDDISNHQLWHNLHVMQQSIGEYVKGNFLQWFTEGRIFPIAVALNSAFYYAFHTLFAYQVGRVFIIWLSFLMIAWWVKLITHTAAPGWLVLFLIPVAWSIRQYHDPLTSFGILLPLVTIFITLSLVFFTKNISSHNKKWLIVSVFFYCCALCTYEIGIAVLPAICALAWIYLPRATNVLQKALPFIIVTIFYIGLSFWQRAHFHGQLYPGIAVGGINHFVHPFVNQVIATFPLSYWTFVKHKYHFAGPLLDFNQAIWSEVLPIVLLLTISSVVFYFLLNKLTLQRQARQALVSIGAVFIVVPSSLVAMSQKYQETLHIGYGYLPVFLQYIGFALLLLAALSKISRQRTRLCVALMLSGILSFSFVLNRYTVRLENADVQAQQQSEATAIHFTPNERPSTMPYHVV